MQPKVIIVWFKRDLRVFDHAPLANAVHDADFVLPLFVVEPDYWRLPTSSRRHWCFVNDCLHELDASLAEAAKAADARLEEVRTKALDGLQNAAQDIVADVMSAVGVEKADEKAVAKAVTQAFASTSDTVKAG